MRPENGHACVECAREKLSINTKGMPVAEGRRCDICGSVGMTIRAAIPDGLRYTPPALTHYPSPADIDFERWSKERPRSAGEDIMTLLMTPEDGEDAGVVTPELFKSVENAIKHATRQCFLAGFEHGVKQGERNERRRLRRALDAND